MLDSNYIFQCKLDKNGRIEYGYIVLKEIAAFGQDIMSFQDLPGEEGNYGDYVYDGSEFVYAPNNPTLEDSNEIGHA